MADKQTKSSDDATPQQPSLSASELLKQHENVMKKVPSDKKRSQQDTTTSEARTSPNDHSSDADTASTSAAPGPKNVREAAGTKSQLVVHHMGAASKQTKQETSKQAERPRYTGPELGRGLSLSSGGFVDLNDIPCSSTSSLTVSCESAKVC